MNNSVQSLTSHFGQPHPANLMVDSGRYYDSPVTLHTSYRNYSGHRLTVVWRSGFKFTLEPLPSMVEKNLLVRLEIGILPSVKTELIRLLSAVDESSTPELKALREAYLSFLGNKSGGARIVLDYPLSMETLRAAGGTVYYHELDCLVSMLAPDQVPPHPFSIMGSHEQLVQVHAERLGGAGFGYSVSVIDSAERYGDRFINIAGKVYRIPAARDTSKRDGIYVVSNAPVQGAYDVIGPQVQHFSFEGAEERLGIFKTAEEAATLGDLSIARKRELAEKEHDIQIDKKNLQQVTAKHELDMAAMVSENEKLKSQADRDKIELDRLRAREEQERQRIKDYYEDKSFVRKDSSEALKLIPSIIIGVGAILALIKALVA